MHVKSSEIVKTILQALESGEDGGERGLTEYVDSVLREVYCEGVKSGFESGRQALAGAEGGNDGQV